MSLTELASLVGEASTTSAQMLAELMLFDSDMQRLTGGRVGPYADTRDGWR
jgi:hypothetical protein